MAGFCSKQRVLEDIIAAIGIWLNIPVEMLPKSQLILLYHLLDWLSIKGCQEVESIYKIIIRLFNVHEKQWLGMLWGSRRTTHALCASPVNEAFLKMLSDYYGEIANSTSFWLDHLKALHQSGGIVTGFEQFCRQSNQNDVVQSYSLLRLTVSFSDLITSWSVTCG
ncbi:putative separase [Rosa chinensis]|uniref:Putative separase n=1 Tax=Rosa chinensis TaxID=74649 RepID=A0A2P6QZV4_ROSCH|nr:putative separase [Rosa chinensis]